MEVSSFLFTVYFVCFKHEVKQLGIWKLKTLKLKPPSAEGCGLVGGAGRWELDRGPQEETWGASSCKVGSREKRLFSHQ